ncbi:MAG: hypothetical protein PUE08_05110 [Eubacteriales bacterium]|nr:hypothetical protein [Eubacteriales bacterium]
MWLIDEAKKYHTIVSVHINFNDAYENAPSFDKFVKANALIRKKTARLYAILWKSTVFLQSSKHQMKK